MNEQNKNNKINSSGQGEQNSLYVDRSEKVKNFKVTLDPKADALQNDTASDKPPRKGEIYFANYSPKRTSSASTNPPPPSGVKMNNTPASNRNVRNGNGARPQNVPVGKTASAKPPVSPNAVKKKRKKSKKSLSTWITIAAIALVTVIITVSATTTINDILNISKSDEPIEVYIPENVSTDEVIDILHDEGLIDRPGMCKMFYSFYSKLRKFKTPEYASGYFDLTATMGLEGMLNTLHVNRSEKTIKITFQEGWSTTKIFSKLEENGICGKSYLVSALQKANYNFDFIKELKSVDDEGRYLLLEGYLFPDTYNFYADTNASAVIEVFLQNFNSKWTKEYSDRAKELGYSMDDIIKIASVIQREAGTKSQMKSISSVIHNRLNNNLSYPTLSCDSTADYIKNDVVAAVGEGKANGYMKYYDTYVCQGLPSGAVCNPGIDAIEAALYPEDTDYYFFMHDASGGIHLSKTFDQHQANINQYLR